LALTDIRRSLPGTVRVVVIRGAGRAFSAGLDRSLLASPNGQMAALAAGSGEAADQRIETWQQAFDWRSAPTTVSLAAVHGYAIGAGFQLALGCDLRILADDAVFAMAEATLGLVPDLGGTKRLIDLVGYSVAADLCLTGRRVDAREAREIGLASRVVGADRLGIEVAATVDSLLKVDRDAAAEVKALLLRAGASSQDAQQAAERQAQYRRLRSLAGLDHES